MNVFVCADNLGKEHYAQNSFKSIKLYDHKFYSYNVCALR